MHPSLIKSRCFYELGEYDKSIHSGTAAIEMNRHFPHVHKYVALSQVASGNRGSGIKTMKQAVLYEAPWSDETIRLNKELLCELMNGQEPQAITEVTGICLSSFGFSLRS